jgi:deazaflavin-dependent oxidoreductase (nitroreductase family)
VIEVVRHHRASDTFIIASGFGAHVDWFRNIQKNPNVLVESGGRHLKAVAEQLPPDAAADELHGYAQRYPGTFRAITKRLLGQELDGSAESCRRLATDVPVIALRPRG